MSKGKKAASNKQVAGNKQTASNKQAASRLDRAITKLMSVYVTAPEARRREIEVAVGELKTEYDALLGRQPASSYEEVTGGITRATERLNQIAADRDNLANTLVSAAAILDVVKKVLGLLKG